MKVLKDEFEKQFCFLRQRIKSASLKFTCIEAFLFTKLLSVKFFSRLQNGVKKNHARPTCGCLNLDTEVSHYVEIKKHGNQIIDLKYTLN